MCQVLSPGLTVRQGNTLNLRDRLKNFSMKSKYNLI